MLNKIKIAGIGVGIIIFVILIYSLRLNILELNNTKSLLCNTQTELEVLKQENIRLNEYIIKKDLELKNLEKHYQEMLMNIPKDSCGDTFPSNELLEYFKKV